MRRFRVYNERLHSMRAKKDILIASHRGSAGISIVDNTIESFQCALAQQADILEMDISMSVDGELFVIHDGMEPRLFHVLDNVQTMTGEQIRRLEYFNMNAAHTGLHPNTLDEVLEHLKDRCMLNFDRSWVGPNEALKWQTIFKTVARHGMEDQVIYKTPPDPKYAKFFADVEIPYLYMPMIDHIDQVTPFLHAPVNMVAVEVHFSSDTEELARPENYSFLCQNGIYLWANALTLGTNCGELAGGHDDKTAMLGDPDSGWGYFVDHGFDIVQSDYVPHIVQYYRSRGCRV